MWSLSEILDCLDAQLRQEDACIREAQTVRGIDSLREIELHPLIAQSFSTTLHTTLREVHYPGFETTLPKRTHRDRCDMVVLPEGKKTLFDPVDAHKSLRSASGTLFEPVASLPAIAPDQSRPEDAMWIEIKIVAQHRYVDGVPIPNARYAHDLLTGPRGDVVKLAAEPRIRHAAVLVVLFGEAQEAGIHDLSMAMRELIDQDLPVGMPEYCSLPIVDLGGNAWCTLGLIPVRL